MSIWVVRAPADLGSVFFYREVGLFLLRITHSYSKSIRGMFFHHDGTYARSHITFANVMAEANHMVKSHWLTLVSFIKVIWQSEY